MNDYSFRNFVYFSLCLYYTEENKNQNKISFGEYLLIILRSLRQQQAKAHPDCSVIDDMMMMVTMIKDSSSKLRY